MVDLPPAVQLLATSRSVGDAFARQATAHPERTALTLSHGSAAAGYVALSYAELLSRARHRADRLAERLPSGERVVLALPTCVEFVEYYLGCLLADLVAVPSPEPVGRTATERLAAIAADCAPALVVTTSDGAADLREQLARHAVAVPVVDPASFAEGTPPDGMPPEGAAVRSVGVRGPDRDSIAVIQYSSGSTGSPHGVILTHGVLLAHTLSMYTHGDLGPEDVYGSWLPFHHDMGLFVMLTAALLFGAPIVLMTPSDFVRHPVEWLRMLDRFDVTVTAGPNFAFDLCARAIPDDKLQGLDLSRLRYAANGSEPIHLPALRAFGRRFAAYGLRSDVLSPCYGLAEATAYVCANRPAAAPLVLRVASERLTDAERPELVPVADAPATEVATTEIPGCGTLGALSCRIVHPKTLEALPQGRIGEIWLRGENVGSGYWNRPELSAELFRARLANDPDTGPWLRTGDLGALLGGELYVTGRIKEMLVVHGRNVFPQDVEHRAREVHPALRGFVGAAFGVAAPDERVVLVHEVDPAIRPLELTDVAGAVARELTTALGVPVRNVLLVQRGSVPRTTSGKIKRFAMRERFLAGALDPLHAEMEPGVRRLVSGGAA